MKKLILIATAFAAELALPLNHASAGEEKTIVGVAAGAGQFNTLVAAVKAAGLVDTLNGAGPFTVFAPTDEAFAKLPAGTVETLLKPENRTSWSPFSPTTCSREKSWPPAFTAATRVLN